MENSLTISEIRRRGMAVINDRLCSGPAHTMKRNKQAAVILSEAQYQQLLGKDAAQKPGMSAMQWLIAQSPVGQRSKATIDADLQNERAW
jgi:PHD/YefM family antitoxin component YafN of YafNO toxin-antitoxin module